MRLRFKKYFGKIATLLAVCMALSSPVMALTTAAAVDNTDTHCLHLQQDAGQASCQQDCCDDGAACISPCAASPATGTLAITPSGLASVTFYQIQSLSPHPNQFLHGVAGVVELHPPR